MPATYRGNIDGSPTNGATRSFKIASGVTITDGDFVYFDGSGRITNASIAGQRLAGVANTGPAGSTLVGNSAGTVESLVVIERGAVYLVDNDNDSATFAATDVGKFFDLVGATGAQLVDTSSGSTSTGQLVCIAYNPQISPFQTDVSQGLYVIAESAFNL